MAANVKVTVGGSQKGMASVAPYSHAKGLQRVMAGNQVTDQIVVYRVPAYEVTIGGGKTYSAVRFGLVNDGTMPETRTCDAGLTAARTCTPSWDAYYCPHSFTRRERVGAWRLMEGKSFLIHEGGRIGGSLGCIEILEDRWNEFLGELEKIAGMPAKDIGAKKMLEVSVEASTYPKATLVA